MRALALALILGLAVSCVSAPPRPVPQDETPTTRRLQRKDPRTGEVVRTWEVLVYPSGRQLKHGIDLRWDPNGTKISEGSFKYGEPDGELRRWYSNGQLRSVCQFSEDGLTSEMKFWHENGQLSATGQAIRGKREGLWTFWFANGRKREEGGYVDSEREGLWMMYHETGGVRSRGRYQGGDRVGPWEHWQPEEPQE